MIPNILRITHEINLADHTTCDTPKLWCEIKETLSSKRKDKWWPTIPDMGASILVLGLRAAQDLKRSINWLDRQHRLKKYLRGKDEHRRVG